MDWILTPQFVLDQLARKVPFFEKVQFDCMDALAIYLILETRKAEGRDSKNNILYFNSYAGGW